ncbi:McrB family protein [Vibrio splendidus]|uniref:McrB family protein n=1 Tax=Vibrio splendidus TaxID=29497 RepID=UPI000D34A4B1|nr:AAA family ATPase [Vibrio splendidus]PTO82877.1 AAA family ATPase [Vibrio splendidus]
MSNDYFTQKHIELLAKWQGQKSDKDNPEQKSDSQQLKQAYDIVARWAEAVQQKLFPEGRVKIRRSPVNQGGNFFPYLWAKIYPTLESPESLAYTVHISADEFAVKIDTINAPTSLVKVYSNLRGDYANSSIVSCLNHNDALAMDFEELVEWTNNSITNFGYTYDDVVRKLNLLDAETNIVKEGKFKLYEVSENVPLNQILYGPPGTGKTYHTIEAAVKAAEPDEYAALGIDSEQGTTEEQRLKLIEKYQSLSDVGRIRFVTFHQSYGYEEFVEGLSAKTERGLISYYDKDGVFKEICSDANIKPTNNLAKFDKALEDLKKEVEGRFINLETSTGKKFNFTYHGRTTFRIYPEESKHEDLGNGYPTSIKHLTNFYVTGDESDIYNRSYVRAILNYMKEKYGVSDYDPEEDLSEAPNYVLVIDEINRGNISKIFGELITLIEPSKRKGGEEEIELLLPCSGDKFSVPSNLHIIGTMNTADRSLAMMDTALRRRFDFVEMMPRADLFSDHCIEWHGQKIDLKSLLEALNKRIEVLYDREHTLGHAFLFPAYNAGKSGQHELAFDELKAAFKNKIIPLLEEYFYEDWNKIRLVLGDSLKQDQALQFLKIKKEKYSDLFGEFHGLELYEEDKITYQVKPFDCDDSIWNRAEAYIGIYSLNSVKD